MLSFIEIDLRKCFVSIEAVLQLNGMLFCVTLPLTLQKEAITFGSSQQVVTFCQVVLCSGP